MSEAACVRCASVTDLVVGHVRVVDGEVGQRLRADNGAEDIDEIGALRLGQIRPIFAEGLTPHLFEVDLVVDERGGVRALRVGDRLGVVDERLDGLFDFPVALFHHRADLLLRALRLRRDREKADHKKAGHQNDDAAT